MPVPKKSMKSTGTPRSGKGSSLFGEERPSFNNDHDPDEKTLSETKKYKTRHIDINNIRLYEDNKFRELDTSDLEDSIESVGLMSPIVLLTKRDDDGNKYYSVISGNRRLTAMRNLYKRAIDENNKTLLEKTKDIFSIVLPLGTTVEEAERVYVDTNILARPLNINDIFLHFNSFFRKDEEGKYINLPEYRPNLPKYAQTRFKKLGYDFGLSTIKRYVTIWMAHNPKIKEDFINNFLTLSQAYTVARMPNDMQDSVMEKFVNMTEKEIADYIRTYQLKLKVESTKKTIRSVDLIQKMSTINKNLITFENINKVEIVNKEDKKELKNKIAEMEAAVEKLKKLVESK